MEISKLQQWANDNEPSDEMVYKNAYWNQIMFIRDYVARILFDYEKTEFGEYVSTPEHHINIISTHTSKSIKLTVYEFIYNDTLFTLRNNFHGWIVSVNSPKEILIDFKNLLDNAEESINSCNCEGFPKDRVYGSYKESKQQFTVRIHENYDLYVFFWLIKNYM